LADGTKSLCYRAWNVGHKPESGAQVGKSQAHKSGRVRRTSREESGAQTTVSRSKRVRLILGDRHLAPRSPGETPAAHKMLWSFLPDTSTCRGVGWRGRIRTFDLLIHSQAIWVAFSSRSSNSARRPAPSESGSVRRTLPEESCALSNSFVNQANSWCCRNCTTAGGVGPPGVSGRSRRLPLTFSRVQHEGRASGQAVSPLPLS
jgi:hypothetical protein